MPTYDRYRPNFITGFDEPDDCQEFETIEELEAILEKEKWKGFVKFIVTDDTKMCNQITIGEKLRNWGSTERCVRGFIHNFDDKMKEQILSKYEKWHD
jgi:hypothetical protein